MELLGIFYSGFISRIILGEISSFTSALVSFDHLMLDITFHSVSCASLWTASIYGKRHTAPYRAIPATRAVRALRAVPLNDVEALRRSHSLSLYVRAALTPER